LRHLPRRDREAKIDAPAGLGEGSDPERVVGV
jgi:hypothetical protein